MILIYKFLPSQVCLILWLDIIVFTYMCASAHREIMLPPGSAYYMHWLLHSSQFVTPSHNLVCMVSFIYLPGTSILVELLHGRNVRSVLCGSILCCLCMASSIFVNVPVLCDIVANIVKFLLIWIFFAWLFCWKIISFIIVNLDWIWGLWLINFYEGFFDGDILLYVDVGGSDFGLNRRYHEIF